MPAESVLTTVRQTWDVSAAVYKRVDRLGLASRLGVDGRVLLLLVVISLVRGIAYAALNPPFRSPDETGHYDYLASLLASGGHKIVGGESHQPGLYYWLMLPAFAVGAQHIASIEIYALHSDQISVASLLGVRLVSSLLSTASIPLAYQVGRIVYPGNRFVCLGMAGVVALLPMYASVSASLNNDALANLLSSALILLLVTIVGDGLSWRRLAWVFVLVAAGMATKTSTYVVIGVTALVLAWIGATYLLKTGRLGTSVVLVTLTGSVALFGVSLPRLIALAESKAFIHKGDLTVEYARTFVSRLDLWPLVYQFKTFWGTFHNDSIMLPSMVYYILAVVCGVSLAGCLWSLVRAGKVLLRKARSTEIEAYLVRPVALLGLLASLQWLMCLGRYYLGHPPAPWERVGGWAESVSVFQGRFLFPALIPIAFFFTWGLSAVLPTRMRAPALGILLGLLLAVDMSSLLTLISSFWVWSGWE